jgi:hypothetical protein
MLLKFHPVSPGSNTDLFFAHVTRGLSLVAAYSAAGFIAAGIVRVSFGMMPEGFGGLVLLPAVCIGLIVWVVLGRRMVRMRTDR